MYGVHCREEMAMQGKWQSAVMWLGLLAGAFFMGYPYVYMFGNSLKTRFEFAADKASIWPERLWMKLGIGAGSKPGAGGQCAGGTRTMADKETGRHEDKERRQDANESTPAPFDFAQGKHSAGVAPGLSTQDSALSTRSVPDTRHPTPDTRQDWPLWKNYTDALTFGRVGIYLRNSFLYALVGTIVQLAFDVLAAYAFARMTFKGRDLLFGLVLSTMMLPPAVLLVPQFLVAKQLNMVDTFVGVIAPGAAGAFGIFMLRQFFLNIPVDLENAARIDGCGDLGILVRIVVPLAKPALITLGLFIFLGTWNSFVWPLVILSDWNMYPLTVGLSLFREESTADWPRIFAASVMGSVPLILLFLMAQRYLIGGIALSGMKT
jgi:multiple sugar transport system permease protein